MVERYATKINHRPVTVYSSGRGYVKMTSGPIEVIEWDEDDPPIKQCTGVEFARRMEVLESKCRVRLKAKTEGTK
jgi:hypothetical protein